MPSDLTFTSSRAAVSAPNENEVYNWPLIRAAIQGVGSRSEWNKTDLVVAGNCSIAGTGSYPAETTWTTINRSGIDATITLTVAVGDIVQLHASGDWQPQAVDSYFALRLHDGTNQLAGYTRNKGAAWTAGEVHHFSMQAVYVAGAAGSVTFSLQTQRGSNAMTVTQATGKLVLGYVHIKKGAA